MSYLKMLGLGARGKLPGAAGLFSTAVISGSSSAPNLRVMIPTASSSNTALEGFGGVPAIRPLETLHNALSLRQLDDFLERVSAPVQLGTPPAPPAPAPPAPPKQPSPTSSAGWSGPSSLMSSSGELPSGLSSAEPSSPNSNYASTSEHKNISSDSSNWSKQAARSEWERAALCLAAALAPAPGSSISGDVTPVSAASELEFHSNEATAGSITDHDILSAEGEDDEETLSVDAGGSPGRVIRNDLSRRPASPAPASAAPSPAPSPAPPPRLYGLSYHDIKDNFYKDMPSSSKNYNVDDDFTSKCTKDPLHYADIESLNLQRKDSRSKAKKHELLNNGSRRYSDGSAQKSNLNSAVSGSRFTTTLVSEDSLRPGSPRDSKSNSNLVAMVTKSDSDADGPLVTKAKPGNIKRGFNIAHNNIE